MRRNYKSFKGINLTVLERMHGGGGRGRDGRGSSIYVCKRYIFEGDQCDGFRNNAPIYHAYPVSRKPVGRGRIIRGGGGGVGRWEGGGWGGGGFARA